MDNKEKSKLPRQQLTKSKKDTTSQKATAAAAAEKQQAAAKMKYQKRKGMHGKRYATAHAGARKDRKQRGNAWGAVVALDPAAAGMRKQNDATSAKRQESTSS